MILNDPIGASDAGGSRLEAELQEAFNVRERAVQTRDLLYGTGEKRPWQGSGGFSVPRPHRVRALAGGTAIGDFEVVEEIGRGGMGVVYRARQISLNRIVALKVLHASACPTEQAKARFQRESQAAARLHHTNIVPVYARGEEGGTCYYAMELINGESLEGALRSDSSAISLSLYGLRSGGTSMSMPRKSNSQSAHSEGDGRSSAALPRTASDYRRIAALLAEVCDGVEHAHQAGIIHRDLKPQNLLLGRDDRLHITDFGLSKGTDELQLTLDGEVMGTLTYMSPEQAGTSEFPLDHHTDVYSLGVTLYEVLTLRRPIEGDTREQVLHRLATATPLSPRRLDRRIPLDLDTICMHALEKEPRRRYASAGAMALDLRRFADDRPILTRRTSLIVRCGKWARRRKAVAAALAFSVLTVFLSAALAASVAVGRRQQRIAGQSEAGWHLNRAYEQLIYRDYKQAEAALDDLQQAEDLGADPDRVLLLRAVAALGQKENKAAFGFLEPVLGSRPADREALYTLAWARQRNEDRKGARAALEAADQQGGARTAGEWFLRGLAVHRMDSHEAGRCYEEARRLRAVEHEFFPQATLHLARSFNHEMYRTRRIERFADAEEMFRQLIGEGVYGSYPYYLLSNTHRLAAEVYADSDGTRTENVTFHFQHALDWARKGQQMDGPEPDRPFTAEAECHESMGDFAAALIARTAAIALARRQDHRSEGFGYRWRLHYWLGDFDQALADLEALSLHEEYEDNFNFSHVYPMLVLAESGRMNEAVQLARSIGSNTDSAWRLIWSATCLRILGRPEEADRLLSDVEAPLDFQKNVVGSRPETWISNLLEFSAGRIALDELLARAPSSPEPWVTTAEAYFHAAAITLASGDRQGALTAFNQAYRSFDAEPGYTYDAKIFRTKMRRDPAWPAWIPN